MKSINEKYAHLQRTSWPQYANTTLGHLPADHYNQIEAAYEAQLATEAGHETPKASVPTPDIEMPVGDSMNSAGGASAPSEAGGNSDVAVSSDDAGAVSESNQPASSNVAGQADVVADKVDETPAEIKSPDDLAEEAAQVLTTADVEHSMQQSTVETGIKGHP